MIFAALITPVEFVKMVAILTDTKSFLIAIEYLAFTVSVAFFLVIIVSFIRLRCRLKLYYADAYQDHKWYLIAEFVFCIFGVMFIAYSNIAELLSLFR